jgi:hypothetical protein
MCFDLTYHKRSGVVLTAEPWPPETWQLPPPLGRLLLSDEPGDGNHVEEERPNSPALRHTKEVHPGPTALRSPLTGQGHVKKFST